MIVRVYGTPAPQGSKKAFVSKTGKINLVEQNSTKLDVWRGDVIHACRKAMDERPPLDGDLHLTVVAWMPRPKTAKNRAFPNVKPDLDKIVRGIGDAMKSGGAYTDDARVVRITAEKRYASDLEAPGALITISACE